MTEEEAKTKLCHQTIDGEGAYVRKHSLRISNCIASDCMAWRWEEGTTPCTDGTRIFGTPDKGRPAEGYCGLAGPL